MNKSIINCKFSGKCVKCEAWETMMRGYMLTVDKGLCDSLIHRQMRQYFKYEKIEPKDGISKDNELEISCKYFPGAHSDFIDYSNLDMKVHFEYKCTVKIE